MVALFLIDMYISKSNDTTFISSWALLKSIMFIGVLFLLLGLDQAIVRLKLKLDDIFIYALIQFSVMATIIAIVLYIFNYDIKISPTLYSLFFLALSTASLW